MKILVTGSDGYIGSLLGPYLLERGHEVCGVDTGFYRQGWLYNDGIRRFPPLINLDVRELTAAHLEGLDAIVHLAELSNDPLGCLKPRITREINHAGSVRLARLGKRAGVNRFVYSSSCSVYGIGTGELKTEDCESNPQTVYARCKVLVERDVSDLADASFAPVFLRNATAFGPSPRMRFDLVLNDLAARAWTSREIRLTSDGTPWRPLVHVKDICRAIACALEAPAGEVSGEIFNVGNCHENYQVKDIARIVAETFPGSRLIIGNAGFDSRSYRVSFEKIHRRLGFFCSHSVLSGARELRALFERIDLTEQQFESLPFTRLQQLKYLLRTEQLDHRLFWRRPMPAAGNSALPFTLESVLDKGNAHTNCEWP